MGLTLKKGSKWWYGDFEVSGQRHVIPLGVEWRGKPPPPMKPGDKLKKRGDEAFERSRLEAFVAFQEKRKEFTDPSKAADRLQRIHQMQMGSPIEKVRIDQLADTYKNALRKKPLAPRHSKNSCLIIDSFVKFIHREYPRVGDIRMVTGAMTEKYMKEEEERGIKEGTYNNVRGTLSAAFETARAAAGLAINPFVKIPKKANKHVIHRKPFTEDEIEAILKAAAADSVVGPVVITAACTGMRLGDCAQLSWASVNLKMGMLNVDVHKTDTPVQIPLLPPLRQVLESRQPTPDDEGYCFPEARAIYDRNSQILNRHLKEILVQAGVKGDEVEVQPKGKRQRKPSRRGFHAFKTTFVTIARRYGIADSWLRKVIGNQVLKIVDENYFRPDDEQLMHEFMSKMPSAFTGNSRKAVAPLVRIESLLDQLASMNPENWASLRGIVSEGLRQLRTGLGG
jgi:integrase